MQHFVKKQPRIPLLKALLAMNAASFGSLLFSYPAFPQNSLVPDNTLGTQNSQIVNLNGGQIRIEGGLTGGENLFHSFTEFSVPTGFQVYFTNPSGIENILTRVTGENVSNIFGTLGVDGTANLFLLNPNGIQFRNGALVNVEGSFVATTANAIQFGTQGAFGTPGASDLPLLTVAPSAFLFTEPMAAPIVNNSNAPTGRLDSQGFSFLGLTVSGGQSVLLVGGDIKFVREEPGNILLDGGRLNVPDGQVDIASISGIGTIGLSINEDALSLTVPDDIPKADVTFDTKARIDVRGTGVGNVAITARDVDILGSSSIRSGVSQGADPTGVTSPGDIIINADRSVRVEGFSTAGSSAIQNYFVQSLEDSAASQATGQGGNVRINTGSLFVTDGGQINTSTEGDGNPGQIIINARDAVMLKGFQSDGSRIVVSSIFSRIEQGGFAEQGGGVLINTGEISVLDGARLSTSTNGEGDAGRITIKADTVSVFGVGPVRPLSAGPDSTSIDSTVQASGKGRSGNISIDTRSLFMADNARIDTTVDGEGEGGEIEIEARSIELTERSRIRSIFNGRGRGRGGDITITGKGDVRLRDNSSIRANVERESGRGGNIAIAASSIIALDDSNIIAFSPDGQGGNIILDTPAFFGENYQPSPEQQLLTREELAQLDSNGRVDINASGVVSGIVTTPDVSFVQDNLADLADSIVDPTQLADRSCIARAEREGSFIIAKSSGFPESPRDASASSYSTVEVESLANESALSQSVEHSEWQPGDPISEPQNMFRLPGGSMALSQPCRQ